MTAETAHPAFFADLFTHAAAAAKAMSQPQRIAAWAGQLGVFAMFAAAGPWPKLTGDPRAVLLFNNLGQGDAGRIGVGIAELIAMVLIVIPRTAVYGAAMAFVLMSGAIFWHLTKIGIAVELPDGTRDGTLFWMGGVAWVAAVLVLAMRAKELPIIGKLLTAATATPMA